MASILPEGNASVLLEADWNREAGEMVEEVIRTQKEVAELLTNHSHATSELQDMKESCEKELEVLQSDAWRLQLYAELERMRSQLELLTPLAQDTCSSTDAGTDASAIKRTSDTGTACSPSEAGKGALFQQDENELQELDQEIATINAELAAAKREMKEMMQLKATLEREVGSVAQLAAEADPGSTAD